ncbi:MAG: PQQ-binding-like beta-propeller repeat protein, partial [Cyclobacteriaceae bacterium]
LITDEHVYVVLQEKDKKVTKKYIRKYELATGKMIWETEKINDAKALPRLELVGNTLVAQIGGLVNQQYKGLFKVESYSPGGSGKEQWRWVNEYVWVGKYGLRGFDASSGSVTWKSDKFKARITRMAIDNGNVFAASAKYFYSIDASSGKENYQVDFKATKVGSPKFSFDIGEAVAIIGDKGVTAFNKQDGSALYSSDKIRNIITYYTKEGKLYMQDKRDDLIQLDLQTGETLGTVRVPKHNSEKKTLAQMTVGGKGNEEQFARIRELSGGADITEDGSHIYVFDGTSVSKYKTN